jgi:hypothetical protein
MLNTVNNEDLIMKLFELAATKPSKQAAKVFESYFGDSINVDVMSAKQARMMLNKVRKLVNEHRQTSAFHHSEKNPAYLKLMMMERVLTSKVNETPTVAVGSTAGATQNQKDSTSGMPPVNPTVAGGDAAKKQQQQAQVNSIGDPKLKAAMQKATQGQSLNPADQQLVAQAALQTESKQLRHSLYKILRESEVQQAQVVLAAQDMVDNVQKMSEEISSMQFKDLPALCDQIKNQIGVDQAMQFNTDATAALAGLLQNLQGARQQLDQALGVVTGQAAPSIPGQDDLGMAPDAAASPEAAADLGGAPAVGAEELPPEEPEAPEMGGAGLGRAKR